MSPTRCEFVTKAVVLPLALAGLSSSRLAVLAASGLAAEQASDSGTYDIVQTIEGHCGIRVVTPNDPRRSFPREIEAMRFADGTGRITTYSYAPRTVIQTRTMDAAFCDAFFAIFTEAEGQS